MAWEENNLTRRIEQFVRPLKFCGSPRPWIWASGPKFVHSVFPFKDLISRRKQKQNPRIIETFPLVAVTLQEFVFMLASTCNSGRFREKLLTISAWVSVRPRFRCSSSWVRTSDTHFVSSSVCKERKREKKNHTENQGYNSDITVHFMWEVTQQAFILNVL